MAFLDNSDLAPFATIDGAKADEMIADAEALAGLAAPCLATPDDLTDKQRAEIKAVLRGAVLRWADTGSGAAASQAWGSYSQTLDTRQPRRTMFWPSEISALQKICKGSDDSGGVFSVDTAAPPMRFRSVLVGGSEDSGLLGAVAFDADYTDDWPFI